MNSYCFKLLSFRAVCWAVLWGNRYQYNYLWAIIERWKLVISALQGLLFLDKIFLIWGPQKNLEILTSLKWYVISGMDPQAFFFCGESAAHSFHQFLQGDGPLPEGYYRAVMEDIDSFIKNYNIMHQIQ